MSILFLFAICEKLKAFLTNARNIYLLSQGKSAHLFLLQHELNERQLDVAEVNVAVALGIVKPGLHVAREVVDALLLALLPAQHGGVDEMGQLLALVPRLHLLQQLLARLPLSTHIETIKTLVNGLCVDRSA